MAVPVVEALGADGDGGGSTSATLDLAYPASPDADDLFLAFCCSDDVTDTLSWDAETGWAGPEAGISDASSVSKSDLAIYSQTADGTETGSVEFDRSVSRFVTGVMARISGADTSDPYDVKGTATAAGGGSSHVIPEVTTSVDDCLAFAILSFDGGDGAPFSVSAGWTEIAQHHDGGGSGSGFILATKDMATAGDTGDCTVTIGGTADSAIFVQFAIAPGGAGPAGTGTLTLPMLAISGTGAEEIPGIGDLTLNMLSIAGNGAHVEPSSGSGALTLPTPVIAGTGAEAMPGVGTLTLPMPSIAGTGLETIPALGDLTLPMLVLAGSGLESISGIGDLTIPMITIVGAGAEIIPGSGALEIPIIQVSGLGNVGGAPSGVGALALPILSIAGAGAETIPGVGALTTPMLSISGLGTHGDVTSGIGALLLPGITIAGTGLETIAATADLALPMLTFSGAGALEIPGVGVVVLPMLSIQGTGLMIEPVAGSGALTLPMMVILGTQAPDFVEGVGLRFTCQVRPVDFKQILRSTTFGRG